MTLTLVGGALCLGACTRDNPAFKESASAGSETGEGTSSATTLDEEGSVGTSSSTSGDGDGDGDTTGEPPGPDLPDCADGTDWIALPMVEDMFVQNGPQENAICQIDYAPGGTEGQLGPSGVACGDLNFGKTPVFWLGTSDQFRSGYVARADLEWLTGRGLQVSQAHYKFPIEYSGIEGDVFASLAPLRDDNADWHAGDADGQPAIEGEGSYESIAHPDNWQGGDVFGGVDISKVLNAYWVTGEYEIEIEVPVTRAQAWLDQLGRHDPGFVLWTDVQEPYNFYITSNEGQAAPKLYVEACYGE